MFMDQEFILLSTVTKEWITTDNPFPIPRTQGLYLLSQYTFHKYDIRSRDWPDPKSECSVPNSNTDSEEEFRICWASSDHPLHCGYGNTKYSYQDACDLTIVYRNVKFQGELTSPESNIIYFPMWDKWIRKNDSVTSTSMVKWKSGYNL